jgi:hypothetical protein
MPYSDWRSWSPFGLGLHFNLDLLPQSSSWVYPDNLPDPHPNALSDRINVYPALYVHTWPNHLTRFFSRSNFYLPDRTRPPYPTSLPDPFLIGLLTTRSYLATLPDFLTQPGYPPMHIPSSHPSPCNILWCNTKIDDLLSWFWEH